MMALRWHLHVGINLKPHLVEVPCFKSGWSCASVMNVVSSNFFLKPFTPRNNSTVFAAQNVIWCWFTAEEQELKRNDYLICWLAKHSGGREETNERSDWLFYGLTVLSALLSSPDSLRVSDGLSRIWEVLLPCQPLQKCVYMCHFADFLAVTCFILSCYMIQTLVF